MLNARGKQLRIDSSILLVGGRGGGGAVKEINRLIELVVFNVA